MTVMLRSALLTVLGVAVLSAASLTDGVLTLEVVSPTVTAGGQVEVQVAFAERRDRKKEQRTLTDRTVTFAIMPVRYALDGTEARAITATAGTDGRFRLALDETRPDWYIIAAQATAIAADDPGKADIVITDDESTETTPADVEGDDDTPSVLVDLGRSDALRAWAVVAVRDPRGAPVIRVHTERARSVFCPGEEVRVWISGRAVSAIDQTLALALVPAAGGPSMHLGTPRLQAEAGKEGSTAIDLPAAFTAAIPPGRHDLVLTVDGREIDRYALRWVAAAPAGAKARWWHGMPFGNHSGLDGNPVSPATIAKYSRWVDGEAKQVHNANLWVQIFADGTPLVPSTLELPGADDPAAPPATPAQRPAATHALYQLLLSRGIALGVMMGGSELGSENYHPLPTINQDHIALVARKYLAGSLSLAQHPNFVGVYTDAYGRPEWHGEGGKDEVSPEQVVAARKAMYEAAVAAAGVKPVPQPPFDFGDAKNPIKWENAVGAPKLEGGQRKAFAEAVAAIVERDHGGDRAALDQAPEAVRLAAWNAAWQAAKVSPVPPARVSYPLPKPAGIDLSSGGPEAEYRYIEFVQRGISRGYAAATSAIERVLPGVFTIQNHNRENHRQPFVYAWRDWTRSPSFPGEYADGVTVVASSEWNLDGEPQPYMLSAEVLRPLLDRGRAVWRTAAFSWNGAQTRFLRDAVFLSGRGITPFFHTPSTATWGHRGADHSTYAAKDRLAAVGEFLTAFEGFFAELEPVREIAYYLRPGWGDENVLSMSTALPASLMTGWQTHVVNHSQLRDGGLDGYDAVLAFGLPEPLQFPFEREAFQEYLAKGGKVFGSPAGNHRYQERIDLASFGIRQETYQEVDADGKPRVDRQGNPIMKERWIDTPDARAQATKAAIWPDFPGVSVLPIDFTQQFARIEADGSTFSYHRRSHWTGFHFWANIAGAALEHAKGLAQALATVGEPLVRVSEPEVFVAAMRPRNGASGLALFAANYTIPKDAAWTSTRVPWFFWPTYAAPVKAEIAIKAEGIGAIYDLMSGSQVATRRDGNRLVFTADMTDLEGRVYVAYPEPIASAELRLPAGAVRAGEPLVGRFTLAGASGAPLGVLGAVRVRLLAADGAVLHEVYRALPADGTLPPVTPPVGASTLEVVDAVAGFVARAALNAQPSATTPRPADPVTVARGDLVHAVLTQPAPLRIVVVDAALAADRSGVLTPGDANPELARDRQAAQQLAQALSGAGVKTDVTTLSTAVSGPLYAHPWQGAGGAYRNRATVPNLRIEGPVIIVGSLTNNAVFQQLERSGVAPRSLASGNTGAGRAVIAALPEAFAPGQDAIAIVASDAAGFAAAVPVLVAIAKQNPGIDSFTAAREAVRWRFVPADVQRVKAGNGITAPSLSPAAADGIRVTAEARRFRGFAARLAPHVFTIDASAGGVAVGLSTFDRPLALINPEGHVVGRYGSGDQVMPRDVAIAADGSAVAGGFALIGRIAGWAADGTQRWRAQGAIVHKDNPLGWDTWKDSERFLVSSPDKRTIYVAAGNDGIQARDAATGAVRWTVPTAAAPPERPLGPAVGELAVSPDGSVLLAYRQVVTVDTEGKQIWNTETLLVDTSTGHVRAAAPANASGWELYASVGVRGSWVTTGNREGGFAIRDDTGTSLRIVRGAELPGSLARSKHMIPTQVLAGSDPRLLVLAKAEATTVAVAELAFGDQATRTKARTALATTQETIAAMREELSDRNKIKLWKREYVEQFMAGVDAPAEAIKLIADKMQRFDAEARAGRRRDFRWITDEFNTFSRMLEERDHALIDAACSLRIQRTVEIPALINDVAIDAKPDHMFVAAWDGMVRCYRIADASLVWERAVGPGCRLALAGDVLYAGSSRGQVSRLAVADGTIQWTTSVLTE